MLRDLFAEESPARAERIGHLVRVYRPVWEAAAKAAFSTYGAGKVDVNSGAQDVVSEEINKMLTPGSNYFTTYDPARGRLGRWVAKRAWNRSIDVLRRSRFSALPDNVLELRAEDQDLIETAEMYELMKEALRLADEIALREGFPEEMTMFKAVRITSKRLSQEERRARGWTEFKERKAVARIWNLIRDTTIPLAADTVSSRPEDATELAQKLWDFMKPRGSFPGPGERTVR